MIIPVYNGVGYIRSMIDMIKAQTYKNIEVIVIDDGSTDGTLEECRYLTQGNDMFRILSKANGGASSARNYGVKNSRGDFIAFIDVDDYIYPEYLEKLYNLIIKYGADWSQCSFIKARENDQIRKYNKMRICLEDGDRRNVLVFDRRTAMIDFAYRRHLNGYPVLKLIKKEIAEQIAFREDLKYSEDYTYIYELIKKTNKVVYIDSVEYLYIQRKGSAVHMKRNRAAEYEKGWEQLKKIYEDVSKTMPYAKRGVLEKCYMQAVKDVSRICDRKSDRKYLNELYGFIKQNGKIVFDDKENTIIRRGLGLAGWISPPIVCFICSIMLHNGFMLRRTA